MFYVESQPGSILEGAFPTLEKAFAYAQELQDRLGLRTQVVGELIAGRDGKAYREIFLPLNEAKP